MTYYLYINIFINTYISIHPLVTYPLETSRSPPYSSIHSHYTTDGDGHQAAGAAAEPGQGGGDCRGWHSARAEGTGDGGTTEKKVVYSIVYEYMYMCVYSYTMLCIYLMCVYILA